MMRSNKNKGFTLVEVLAAIVILGILSTIGIVTVTNIRKNQEKKFDQTQLAVFKQTAKTYFSDHKSLLPTTTESTYRVYLSDLINENYIDSLLKYNKKSYDKDKSYVLVTKIGTEYVYKVMLCKEINNKNICDDIVEQDNSNKSTISFSNYRKDNSNTEIEPMDDSIYYSNRTTRVDYKITDIDGIKAVIYYIYKNGKKINTGKEYNPNVNEANDTITFDMNDYEDGKYEIEISVYDQNDNKTTKRSSSIYIDRINPVCTVSGGSTTWINSTSETQSRIISATCTDTGSGCLTNKLSKEYKSNIKTTSAGALGNGVGGTVEDKAGNKTNCLANQTVKIDKTAPVVSLSVSSQNADYNTTTANVITKITENNSVKYELSTSGFSDKTYSQMTTKAINGDNNSSIAVSSSYDGTKKTIYVTVIDIAGNKSTKSTTYSVYESCSKTVANGNPTYGACSATCGTGTKVQTQPMKDSYLGVSCASVQTTVSCGSLPDCCSSVRYVSGSTCTVTCGGGTYNQFAYSNYNNQRCTNKDLSSGGDVCNTQSCCTGPTTTYTDWTACNKKCKRNGVAGTQTRTKTVTQCDGTSTSTIESQECNTFTCCSSTTTSYSDWSTCKRRGSNRYPNKTRTATKYSTYDNGTCGSSTEEKTCTIDSHTHEWKARGNTKVTDNANWTCSGPTVHSGHNSHYNIYCKKCGAQKTTSLKWVCPTLPYTSADGWAVIDD